MYFISPTSFLLLFCSVTFITISCTFATSRPIIASSMRVCEVTVKLHRSPRRAMRISERILAQGSGCKLSQYDGYNSAIAASYVKFLESAGARVVPIMIRKNKSYYKSLLSRINGVLLPGGPTSFDTENDYADAGELIFNIAKKFNDNDDHFPIWGTCLGFELLTYLAANRTKHRKSCTCENDALNLNFAPYFRRSKMFREAPDDIIDILKNEKVTYNSHKTCITKEALENVGLENDFRITSYGYTATKTKFISSLEHVKYPFYGVQFHPEKNTFEWKFDLNIPHTRNAIKITHFFADFFVNEARKSDHKFNYGELPEFIIYKYSPKYTGLHGSDFEQCYMFP